MWSSNGSSPSSDKSAAKIAFIISSHTRTHRSTETSALIGESLSSRPLVYLPPAADLTSAFFTAWLMGTKPLLIVSSWSFSSGWPSSFSRLRNRRRQDSEPFDPGETLTLREASSLVLAVHVSLSAEQRLDLARPARLVCGVHRGSRRSLWSTSQTHGEWHRRLFPFLPLRLIDFAVHNS